MNCSNACSYLRTMLPKAFEMQPRKRAEARMRKTLLCVLVLIVGASNLAYPQQKANGNQGNGNGNSGNGNGNGNNANGNGKSGSNGTAPEIDPAAAVCAIAVLSAGTLIIRGRRK